MRLWSKPRLALLASLMLVLGAVHAPHAQAGVAINLTTVDLAMLRNDLVALAPVGSAARIDPDTGGVLLKLAGEPSAQLKNRLAKYPGLVQTQRSAPVKPMMLLYAGLGISSEHGDQQCTAGFIATRPGGASYVLSAGHCVKVDNVWERKQTFLGARDTRWEYGPTGDFGLIQIRGVNMTPRGWINTPDGPIAVTGSRGGEFEIGQYLCHMGNATKLQCGTVTRYGYTVSYPDGMFRPPVIVDGLVEMMGMCAKKGDSGGPLFSNDGVNVFGWGIISGATDLACGDPNFRSYYQPLQEVLEYYEDLPLRIES